MKYHYQELLDHPVTIDLLEVHCFDMNIHLVSLHTGIQSGMLYENQHPMRFHNTQQVRDAFDTIVVKRAVLKHESPFDEMIGNPPKADNGMVLPFSMKQPY